jgi:hypothetical protein
VNIPDFDRKKQYYRAFWEREVLDRPLVNVKAPTGPHLPAAYLEGAETGAYLPVLEKAAANFRNTWFGGEALPSFQCSLGPDQFAAFLGGKIEFSSGVGTSWVKPFWDDDYSEADVQIDTSQGSYFDRLMTFIKTAADIAEQEDSRGNGFLVEMLDLHTNLDALMAARGSENLCMDLADDPDRVERVLQKIVPLFPFVVDSAAKAGNMEKNGYTGWIPTYSEKKFAVIQCDFSIMISPEMCRRFLVPALEYEASCLEHCIYHYDGPGALTHLDEILGIQKINAIQWVPGAGQPRTIEWMDLLKKIQKAGKRLWLYDWTIQEIKEHFKELDPRGLMFDVHAQSPAEGEELLEYLKKRM